MESLAITQLSALAHPRRLALFRLLMRRFPGEVPAGDLAQALDLPPSSLSAALAQLRQAGLIGQRREGTSLLYQADTTAAAGLVAYLAADCCRGRPDICLLPDHDKEPVMSHRKYAVLFICTGNSARSIMAETLLREMAGDRFEAHSAGTRPYSELNPRAVALLQAKGHDVSGLRAKHVSEFQGAGAPPLDFVFTVCDRAANEECPPWPGQPITGHWGQPDPVRATGTEAERQLAFQQVYGALRNRIAAFAALPFDSLDRVSLQARVDTLGQTREPA
ncbi:metalloregulator ArsR/SmtB family transcription factor [Thetidibacter halocola]|uniref:Metalloregulator ArsR/SmtB family transcription factor n=1 Tax=Thetidibacter halocola TaxID=2827239 RepID=A0A8J7WCD0_9RHOB|nr:metalloregulator ArsR/SmtB family transcription factor [Thetidibacter halocola]MBS0124970.1 metalloregulator ArsR/SmtB family transcription factor [Thetidibacter halocola]